MSKKEQNGNVAKPMLVVDVGLKEEFYCDKCKSIYPCSTQNFGLKCEFEVNYEIKNYGKISE